jgi:membrane protease YdiL (CAAX protease family)
MKFKDIHNNLKLFFGGCVISIFSFLTIFLIEYSEMVYTFNTTAALFNILKSTAYCVFVAIIEEFIFRYLFLKKWIKDKERKFTVSVVYLGLFSSTIFGFLHFNMELFPLMQINLVLSGISMFIATYMFRSISIAIGMHFSWNFIQGVVFPFEGSGSHLSTILSTERIQKVFPEASPFMIFSFIVEILLIWALSKISNRDARLQTVKHN